MERKIVTEGEGMEKNGFQYFINTWKEAWSKRIPDAEREKSTTETTPAFGIWQDQIEAYKPEVGGLTLG